MRIVLWVACVVVCACARACVVACVVVFACACARARACIFARGNQSRHTDVSASILTLAHACRDALPSLALPHSPHPPSLPFSHPPSISSLSLPYPSSPAHEGSSITGGSGSSGGTGAGGVARGAGGGGVAAGGGGGRPEVEQAGEGCRQRLRELEV